MTKQTTDQPVADSGGKAEKSVSVAGSIRFGDHVQDNTIGHKSVINTDGGAYIGGNVNTDGGAFVGRDQYTVAPPNISLQELQLLVAELGNLLRQAKLPADIGEIVESDFKVVKRQLEQDTPKGALVKSRLGSLKELLSGAETATGLGERIVAVLSKAAQLAGLLFP
jgi:hypothetical protein